MIVHRSIQGSNVPFMDEGAFPKFREHSSVRRIFLLYLQLVHFLTFMYIKSVVPGVH